MAIKLFEEKLAILFSLGLHACTGIVVIIVHAKLPDLDILAS